MVQVFVAVADQRESQPTMQNHNGYVMGIRKNMIVPGRMVEKVYFSGEKDDVECIE